MRVQRWLRSFSFGSLQHTLQEHLFCDRRSQMKKLKKASDKLYAEKSIMLVDRITSTLITDRFNINYETHITLNSHQFTLYLVSHALRHWIFPITTVSRQHARSRSFFLLPWNASNTQITPHHNYMHTHPSIRTLCIFIPQYIIIYGNHYRTHNWTNSRETLSMI